MNLDTVHNKRHERLANAVVNVLELVPNLVMAGLLGGLFALVLWKAIGG